MTHVHEDIGAFVLGALDEDGERRVREHLATCTECAATLPGRDPVRLRVSRVERLRGV